MTARIFASFLVSALLAELAAAQIVVDVPDGPNVATIGDPLNQDRAKFSVSVLPVPVGPGTERAFYYSSQNNRILFNRLDDIDGTWDFPTSQVAISFTESLAVPSITIAVGVVLRSESKIFVNALDGAPYRYAMYFIFQAGQETGFGLPCVAFSHDGVTWADRKVRVQAAPVGAAIDCSSQTVTSPKLEAIGGSLLDSGLLLAGMEGDHPTILSHLSGRTLTYVYSAVPSTPHSLTLVGEIPTQGIEAPTNPGGDLDLFFVNLDLSYDRLTDRVFLARAIPFPYSLATTPAETASPCSFNANDDNTNVCPSSLFSFPMRAQVYSKVLGGDPGNLVTGSWRLDLDIGRSTGWAYQGISVCEDPFEIFEPFQRAFPFQTAIDIDSVNFFKDQSGLMNRETAGGGRLYFGGYQDRQLTCDIVPNAASTFLDGLLYSYVLELPMFEDGFETGGFLRWSASEP